MKRILALTLAAGLLIAMAATLTGCGGSVDEAALCARAAELVPKTALINRLFHIEGLPLKEGSAPVGGYRPVDMNVIESYGYENLEGIIESMHGVWTDEYIGRFRESSLFSAVGTGSTQESKYCYDQYDIKTKEYEGIWALSEGPDNPTDPVEYLYDTLAVKKIINKNLVRMTMQVIVTDSEDASRTQRTDMTFTMARESKDAEWLLDSSVVVKFYIEESV